jgi:hypothetical protein
MLEQPAMAASLKPTGLRETPGRFTFVHLNNQPTYPLDRLSKYEAALWRQACQILFTLQCFDQRKPWEKARIRFTFCRSYLELRRSN